MNYIFIPCTRGTEIPDPCHRLFLQAAQRWDARLVYHPMEDDPKIHPWWDNLNLLNQFCMKIDSWDRVLKLDGTDMLIHPRCPNPFIITLGTHDVGVVSVSPNGELKNGQAHARWNQQPVPPCPPFGRVPNGGFLLGKAQSLKWFAYETLILSEKLSEDMLSKPDHAWDQMAMASILANPSLNPEPVWLDPLFNRVRCHAVTPVNEPGIYHFNHKAMRDDRDLQRCVMNAAAITMEKFR